MEKIGLNLCMTTVRKKYENTHKASTHSRCSIPVELQFDSLFLSVKTFPIRNDYLFQLTVDTTQLGIYLTTNDVCFLTTTLKALIRTPIAALDTQWKLPKYFANGLWIHFYSGSANTMMK